MRDGRHGRVIQGFFVGTPRVPASSAAPRAVQPPRPGPPVHAAPRRAIVQAKPLVGPPVPCGHRAPAHPHSHPHGADQRFEVDPVRIGLARTGGVPLPGVLLAKMEAAFGTDFSAVRVHVGPQPSRIGALAFTTGDQLYFAPGQYQPDTPQGQRLIGHELAHVIQQRQGRVPAHGGGVTVIQNKLLEAEADRLGARAAAWHVARPAAPARPGLPAAPGRPAPARAVQRATEPQFRIDGNARNIFDKGGRWARQTDIDSIVPPNNDDDAGFIPHDQFRGRDYVYSDAAQGVIARLKVNGHLLVIGTNAHTSDNPSFLAGTQMRNSNKDNFHAEDWVIRGFKEEFAKAKRLPNRAQWTLDDWLDTLGGGKAGNAGSRGKHFISLAVSACPCLGCTVSLREFQHYLATELGPQGFVFRVKFLRPYELSIKTKDRTGTLAKAFVSTIGGLREMGIHVRMQPTRSARKLVGSNFTGEVPRGFATNHDAVHRILSDEQGAFLRQSWYEMGVSRKGVMSFGEAPVYYKSKPSRERMGDDLEGMLSDFVIPGSQAAAPPRKGGGRGRSVKGQNGAQVRGPTLRYGPYPGSGNMSPLNPPPRTTTTTTTTTAPPMPMLLGPLHPGTHPPLLQAPMHQGGPYHYPAFPPPTPHFYYQQQQQQHPMPQPQPGIPPQQGYPPPGYGFPPQPQQGGPFQGGPFPPRNHPGGGSGGI